MERGTGAKSWIDATSTVPFHAELLEPVDTALDDVCAVYQGLGIERAWPPTLAARKQQSRASTSPAGDRRQPGRCGPCILVALCDPSRFSV
jgi:hypothetical protein